MTSHHPRITIVGTSCSGKTTLAKRLAAELGRPHIELDALYWGRDWAPRPDFHERVAAAVAAEEWIAEGNYRPVRDLVWGRATAIIWINLPFTIVFAQALQRTCRRIYLKERLYADNRETIRKAFFDRDSILLWVLSTYHRRRREYRLTLTRENLPHLEVFELRSRAEIAAFPARLRSLA